jgi:TonB family protein
MNSKKILNITIFLSLIVHISFLSFHRYKLSSDNKKNQQNNEQKKVLSVIKIKPEKYKQIVQTTESDNKEVKDDSYLGEKNNTFDRQTVAKVIDSFREARTAGTSLTKKNQTQASRNKNNTTNNLSNLGIGIPAFAGKNTKEVEKNNKNDQEMMKDIMSQTAANNDYVKEIPLADVTRFNTVEYRHFGFYQRIRSQLELHWGSSLKDKAKKIYKSGRKIASESDFITNIEVILDKTGIITGINIIGTSGVKELDDAAIESFNKAGPFPNPPKDLISNSGTAVIKWGFVVKS